MKKTIKTVVGILLAGALGSFTTSAFADDGTYRIAYDSTPSTFSVAGADLFSHIESGLPADTLAGTLMLDNESDVACEFYASTKETASTGPEDTLDRITLRMIDGQGDTFYEGPLADADGVDPVSLGVFEPGGGTSIDYELIIPEELTNDYEDIEVSTNVLISVEEHPEEIIEGAPYDQTGTDSLKSVGTAAGIGTLGLLAAVATAIALRNRFASRSISGIGDPVAESIARAKHSVK